MSQEQAPFKVIIIGAGLSGSLLANGLLKKGIEVAVYERLERNSKREGYQIRLGAPALKGLRACLTPSEVAAVASKFGRAGGSKSAAPVCYDSQFRELLNLSRFEAYSKSAPINRVLLRDALADPLWEAGVLRYGAQFQEYQIVGEGTEKERVRVFFSDGSSDEADMLIGADGSHSKINVQLGLNNLSTITSHLSMVSKAELPTSKYLTMSKPLRETPVLSFAENKTMFFCAYLPDRVESSHDNVTTTDADFDDELSSCMFGLHLPLETCPSDLKDRTNDEKWTFITTSIQHWASEYHEIINLVKGSDVYVYQARVSSRPPLNWRRASSTQNDSSRGHSRVWLLGDAMHAMLPTRGMGGNQAMQDVSVALPLLEKLANKARDTHRPTLDEITQACTEYENEMIPRAFTWVQKSGGSTVVPIDGSQFSGKVMFFLLAQVLRIASLWKTLVGCFVTSSIVDEAPELKT